MRAVTTSDTVFAPWRAILLASLVGICTTRTFAEQPAPPLTMLVMDPLAAQLACPCVAGHAQRDYDKLAAYLSKKLDRPVKAVFGDDLGKALRGRSQAPLALIIGKRSVVAADAAENRFPVRPLAMLTDKAGTTTLHGLFVVRSGDKAKRLADLNGYKILFGTADSNEKHAAAIAALRAVGIESPAAPETRDGCSTAALEVAESSNGDRTAAVISSYAMPLLEGCGTIEKGALRVVGRTAEVPFVIVFTTDKVSPELRLQIQSALVAIKEDGQLLRALESKQGFVAEPDEANSTTQSPSISTDWPGWRGAARDAHVAYLPKRLPATAKPRWTAPLASAGLGGIAATLHEVVVSDRDSTDASDIFLCLEAATGAVRWRLTYPAPGKLDYGNSPRTTPLIHEGKVYLLGAFGNLHCAKLSDGSILWKKNIVRDYQAKLPTWGMTASPLAVEGRLIVNPGAADASLVALDCLNGNERWRCPGLPAAYASFIVGSFGGVRQIVGYDSLSLGGWDIHTGRRLWTLVPPEKGDFNVPTPIALDGKLLVSSENNGTRFYDFDRQGHLQSKPLAEHAGLAPDASTPVVVNGQLFGCRGELLCLNAVTLKDSWAASDKAFDDYASIIASRDRLLILSKSGELLLVAADARRYQLISRLQVFEEGADIYAHPALVGKHLYLRGPASVCCLTLD